MPRLNKAIRIDRRLATISRSCISTLLTLAIVSPFSRAEERLAIPDCNSLPPPSTVLLQETLGDYLPLLSEKGIEPNTLRELDLPHIVQILDQAISLNLGILHVMTSPLLAQETGCRFFIGKDALQQVDALYNLHGLWMINAPFGDNRTLTMNYLIFGDGKLALGYPQAEVIQVRDYDFYGGKFAYTPFLTARIVNQGDSRGITEIAVRSSPQDRDKHFRGPGRSTIRHLFVDQKHIHVHYSFFGFSAEKSVDYLPIEKRKSTPAAKN